MVKMSSKLLHLSFNRDATSLSVGTVNSCFHLSVDTPETPERLQLYGNKNGERQDGTLIVNRLGRTSLAAFVSLQTPRKLRIQNLLKNEEICSHAYKNSILSVKLTRLKLMVCLETRIYIHASNSMKCEHVINTNSNPNGILAVSEGEEQQLLIAFPASDVTGEVQIFNGVNFTTQQLIRAHAEPLSCLEFNDKGTLLASSSIEGTYIFIFSPLDGIRLYKCYRGLSQVDIFCLKFSPNDCFLGVTSSNPTIHIFKLKNDTEDSEDNKELDTSSAQEDAKTSSCTPNDWPVTNENTTNALATSANSYFSINSWIGWAKSTIVPTIAPMLPENISDSLSGSNRAFTTIRLPYVKDTKTKSIIAFATSYCQNGPEIRILVGAYDGYLYIFKLNKEVGGDCELLKQVQLL